jgi:hypothetical protein
MGLEIIMGVVAGAGIWLERMVSKRREQDGSQPVKVDAMPKYPET